MSKRLGILLALLFIYAINAALLMVFWNWLMPYLFALPKLGYWQAIGLEFLLQALACPIKLTSKRLEEILEED